MTFIEMSECRCAWSQSTSGFSNDIGRLILFLLKQVWMEGEEGPSFKNHRTLNYLSRHHKGVNAGSWHIDLGKRQEQLLSVESYHWQGPDGPAGRQIWSLPLFVKALEKSPKDVPSHEFWKDIFPSPILLKWKLYEIKAYSAFVLSFEFLSFEFFIWIFIIYHLNF